MFALEAAAAGLPIDRLAVYDVPYDPDPRPRRYDEYRARLAAALAADRRGDAVALFMGLAGSSEADIEAARRSPYWPGLEALAPTLAHDAALYGPPPADRLATVTQRPWSPPARGTRSSRRRRTRSPRTSRTRCDGRSPARATSPIPRSWRPRSGASSRTDAAVRPRRAGP